ncbi:NAD(P)-dependent oxidoreductase [Oxalobacteraceae bacterium OTU3CINTB1]|nr:NAD(P)-dependent oxidoreductase [Oxalobacteraceae bacterium OTU3CINTB1]
MTTVLVTGASGFLGRRVVLALERAGHQVRAGVRRPVQAAALGWGAAVTPVRCDVLTGDGLAAACDGVDAVIHLAADMGGDEAGQIATAVGGTERLIAALGPATTRLVLASSFSVYDWERVGAELDEDAALLGPDAAARQDGYARAKLAQERAARAACAARALALTVLRPATIWAAGRRDLDGVGVGAGQAVVVIGPGRAMRLTHVDNCAAAFAAALDPRAAGHTFNVDDGYPVTAWQHAGRQGAALRLPLPYGLARAGAALGGALLGPLRRGRPLPGLLVPARLRARFHGARAGHAALTRVLGWTPPLSLQACLRTG